MARPLSLDLRERIVEAVAGGLSRRAAAVRFRVSESCAIKLLQRWERTGSVAPGAMGGTKRFALEPHEALVRELVAAQPDITLDELAARLAVEGIEVGRTSVHRFLTMLGLTRKKRRSMRPSRIGPTSPMPGAPGARAKRG
jgi:putative transposase